jgi:hypothetical protein
MSKAVFTLFAASAFVSANAAWFTDENEFLNMLSPAHYLEDFDDFQFGVNLNGTQTAWTAPGGNGYGWDASAPLGLWSVDGAISTSESEDTLTLTFTGSPVTAFGGVFYATDSSGFIVPQTEITVFLSNNETQTFTSDGLDFLGWTGGSAIASVELSVAANSATWITADHVYTGAAVPEPLTIVALSLGAAGLFWRKRSN